MNAKNITRRLAVVAIMVMLVSSMVASPLVGSLVPTAQPSHQGIAAAEDCSKDFDAVHAVSPVGAMIEGGEYTVCTAGNIADSLFGDTDNTAEIESLADSNNALVRDTIEDSQTSWTNDKDAVSPTALSKADGEVIQAHYDGKTETEARADGQMAIREEYAAVESAEINSHNQIIEVTYGNSKQTHSAEDVSTTSKFRAHAGKHGSGGYSHQSYAHLTVTENATLQYSNVTLADGTEMERVSEVTHLKITGRDNDNNPISDLNPGANDRLQEMNSTSETRYTLDLSPDGDKKPSILLINPYTDEEETFGVVGTHNTRMTELQEMRDSDMQKVNNLTEGYYEQYGQGDLEPSDATMYYQLQQQAESGGLSFHVLKFLQLGLSVDVDQTHTWTVDNSTHSGVIATGATGLPKVADADPVEASDGSGSVSLTNIQNEGILTFSNETKSKTIKFEDGSDLSNVSVNVHNVDDYNVSQNGSEIAVEIAASDLQDDFVTFEVTAENTTSGTYIAYINSDAQSEGIPQGLTVGESYAPGDYNGPFRAVYETDGGETIDTTLDSEFALDAAYGPDGDERTYVTFDDEKPEKMDSDNVQDRIEWRNDMDDIIADPPRGGGGDDGGMMQGILIGAAIVGAVVLVLIVLWLVGRITSVA